MFVRARRRLEAWRDAPPDVWRARVMRVGRLAVYAAAGTVVLVVALAAWRARFTAPEPTLLLRDRQGRFLGEVGATTDGEYGYWPIAELPGRVVAATTVIEDRRLRSHPGVDPLAVARALRDNLRSGRRVSGASTLAMQVARMQHPGGRSYGRKALEALSAVFMTLFHGRDAVLAQYLRIVPYGNRIHGISYAARRYLDKPVEDLSWAETAFLAAIPQSPAHMNPFLPLGRARAVRRGREILDRLRDQGCLTSAEHALANAQIENLVVPPAGERPRDAMHALLRLERQLTEPDVRRTFARRPIVTTTLDLDLQQEAAWQVRKAIESWEPQGARNAALVVLDRPSNEVRAWVGSADYFDTAHAGAIDYTAVPRSPGSALKPFIYGLALERGVITPATILDDLDRAAGGVTNADGLFLGPLLPRVALANSRNVPATELLARIGVDEAYAFLRDLGLHDGAEPARHYGLGLAIGGMPVTLERLLRAYTALAREGQLGELAWFEGQPTKTPRRVLSESSARQVALFLADPMARLPSFARMGSVEYPFPVAVKTGTSSRFRDAWAVAYSSRYVIGAWVGDPDCRPMHRLTGFSSAAELVKRMSLALHHDQAQGLDDLAFPSPRGFVPVRLCALTGALASDACDRVLLEWLSPSDVPRDTCRAHVRLAIDTRTGRLATRRTPRQSVELRTFFDLPPRYSAWAAAAGLPAPPSAESSIAPTIERLANGVAQRMARLSITSPENGLRLLRDPETPPETCTLALRVVIDPPAPQVLWVVDGRPYAVVEHPYVTRWKLQPGEHVIQARLPNTPMASSPVRVFVD
jgi:penicillin-binding protein 1C